MLVESTDCDRVEFFAGEADVLEIGRAQDLGRVVRRRKMDIRCSPTLT